MAASNPQRAMRTQICTVLDSDHSPGTSGKLMLTMVQGAESFSLPYTIDLQMYGARDLVLPEDAGKTSDHGNISPRSLINTPATMRLRIENVNDTDDDGAFRYIERKGIFQTFARQPRVHQRLRPDLNVYIGRLVPAFLVMAQEVRYRIFENKTGLEIVQSCMQNFQGLNLSSYISPDSLAFLANDDFGKVKLEHAVQYGESTFNFLSRLMNRASIWYNFDHTQKGSFETMVLGKGPVTGFHKCEVFTNYMDPRDLHKVGAVRPWEIIFNPARTYTPSPKLVRVGEFNTVNPTHTLQSIDGKATIVTDALNIINAGWGSEKQILAPPPTGHNEPNTSFIQESFPDLGAFDDGDTTNDATTALEIAEAQVEVLTGLTGNASFVVGNSFALSRGAEEDIDDHTYLITQFSYAGYDRNYLYAIRPNVLGGLGALFNDIIIVPIVDFLSSDDTQSPDPAAAALAATALEDYVSTWVSWGQGTHFGVTKYAGRGKVTPVMNYTGQIVSNVTSAMAGLAGAFVPTAYQILRDIIRLIEMILDGVITVIATVFEIVAGAILAIPTIIQHLFHRKTWYSKVKDEIEKASNWLKTHLHPFFQPQYVDGFSGSFSANLLSREGTAQNIGIPLPTAQRTQVFGPHLATVIGPTGINATGKHTALHADKLGRVRVRFPWDRSPAGIDAAAPPDTGDKPQYLFGEQTVWVRVSQLWASQGYGGQFLPRIGDEVIISFIDGDPDRPVITGQLYNPGGTGLSNLPFPAAGQIKTELGKDDSGAPEKDGVFTMKDLVKIQATTSLTRSGIRTRAVTPANENAPGFHLLRFDDSTAKSQTLLRSQGRLDVTAFGTKYQSIGGDYNLTVGGIDMKTHLVGGNYVTKIFRDYTLHVGDGAGANGGYRYEKVEKDYELNVKNDYDALIEGDIMMSAGYRASLYAKQIMIEAKNKISLKVGNSYIVITPAGVYASGPLIGDNSGGSGVPADQPSLTLPIADPKPADSGGH